MVRAPGFSATFLVVFLIAAASVSAQTGAIRLNVGPGGYPPYMITQAGKPASGIMVDVFSTIAARLGYAVNIVEIPRARVDGMLETGKLDVTPRAIEWSADPTAFVYSDVVTDVREVIFVVEDSPAAKLDDLFGKRMGVRLGYVTKELDPYFANGTLIRDNAPDEVKLFQKLALGRTEAVDCVELVGWWVVKQLGKDMYGKRVRALDREISKVGYRFMFAPSWRPFIAKFNQELAAMKRNGEIAAILRAYR